MSGKVPCVVPNSAPFCEYSGLIIFFGLTFAIAVATTTVTQGLKNWAINATLLGRFIFIWLIVMCLSAALFLGWNFTRLYEMLGAIN